MLAERGQLYGTSNYMIVGVQEPAGSGGSKGRIISKILILEGHVDSSHDTPQVRMDGPLCAPSGHQKNPK